MYSLVSAAVEEHWMVEHCLEQLLGRQIQENIQGNSWNIFIYFELNQTPTGKTNCNRSSYRLGRGDYFYTIAEMTVLGGFNGMFYCTRGFTSYYRLYVEIEYFKAHAKI